MSVLRNHRLTIRLALALMIVPLVVDGQDNLLLQSLYDLGPSTNSELLGFSAAIEGSIAVLGAPLTHAIWFESDSIGGAAVFDLNTGRRLQWLNPIQGVELHAGAGWSVSISRQRIAVGAPGFFSSARGSVYLYDLSVTNGEPIARIDGTNGSQFGTAVALSGDRMVVGAPSFERGYASFFNLTRSKGEQGYQTVIENPDPTNYVWFGRSISMSGSFAAIAASKGDASCAAWIYDLGGDSPSRPLTVLKTPAREAIGYLYPAVSLSDRFLVLGIYGRGFVYDLRSTTAAVPILTLINPIPTDSSYAWSVAISGTRIVVGARDSEVGGYVYDLTNAAPSNPIQLLYRPQPGRYSGFGQSVAIHDSTIVIGAPSDPTTERPGGGYVYGLRPVLSVRTISQRNASVSWIPATPGFLLETADQFELSGWRNIVFTNGSSIDITNGKQFFRLVKP
jgi:hypothetical protein